MATIAVSPALQRHFPKLPCATTMQGSPDITLALVSERDDDWVFLATRRYRPFFVRDVKEAKRIFRMIKDR